MKKRYDYWFWTNLGYVLFWVGIILGYLTTLN